MIRRKFLGTVAGIGAATAGYAAMGVLSDGQPEPEIVRFFSPEPRWISHDYEQYEEYEEFTGTIQNTRERGSIIAHLYLSDRRVEDVNQLDEEAIENDDDFEKIATQEVYFDADERRDVVFRERIPEDDDPEWFIIWSKPATRGAVIRNDGASGNVRVMLWEGEEGSEDRIDEQTTYVGSDETERFTFESRSFSSEKRWGMEAEPAD